MVAPGAGEFGFERKPIKRMGSQRQEIGVLSDGWEFRPAKQLNGHRMLEGGQIQLDGLGEAGEIGDDQNRFVLVSQDIAENFAVLRLKKFAFSLPQRAPSFPQSQQS